MNAAELFWDQTSIQQVTHQLLTDFFRQKLKTAVESGTPEVFTSAVPFTVQNIAMLRINTPQGTGAFSLGSSQPNFAEQFAHTMETYWKEITASTRKSAETSLMQMLATGLQATFQAKGLTYDPKSCIALPSNTLGAWNIIHTSKAIRFPFVMGGTKLCFELPIFDEAYRKQTVLISYGFAEEAKILVVDDSNTTRKLSRHHLNSVGYLNVEECVDGQAAFAKLEANPGEYELVIADWHMPNLTGLDLLKKIRAHAQLRGLPVVLATGERNKEEVTKALKEGVSGYVVKPFEAETLFKAVKAASTKVQKKAA